ncbi:hypothetical protein DFS33DRAFT_1274967 [Desarmillaria ectypa]|nr:hypothetical protein DFS33DRAFT_1274967 [Desarmillaria ectypa]
MHKLQHIRRVMVIAIVLLFLTTIINFGLDWYRIYIVFIEHGQTFWSKYLASQNPGSIMLGMGFTTSIYTVLADSTVGIAPMLLGRVTTGCACPDDSWKGSVISSLYFQMRSKDRAQTSSRRDSVVHGVDLEAQLDRKDEAYRSQIVSQEVSEFHA